SARFKSLVIISIKKPALACRFLAEKEGFAEPAGSGAGGSDRPQDAHSLPPGSNPLLLSA
ncbi:MAG: hypothetical protein IJF16_07725, partial [Clostridia bacterium]|nr:hypothetical protein [Clostridia bacterium]